MKRRVIVLDGLDQVAEYDIHTEFFSDFPPKRLLRTLSGLHLSAREFPLSLEFPVSSGCRKYALFFPQRITDDSCDYFDCFHSFSLSRSAPIARQGRSHPPSCAEMQADGSLMICLKFGIFRICRNTSKFFCNTPSGCQEKTEKNRFLDHLPTRLFLRP